MKVISFQNEVKLLSDLAGDTVSLIHHTSTVAAIRRLLDAHDILDLALRLTTQYEAYHYQPPWTKAASKDLDAIRCELVSRYADAFDPLILLPRYYSKVGSFLDKMSLRII